MEVDENKLKKLEEAIIAFEKDIEEVETQEVRTFLKNGLEKI